MFLYPHPVKMLSISYNKTFDRTWPARVSNLQRNWKKNRQGKDKIKFGHTMIFFPRALFAAHNGVARVSTPPPPSHLFSADIPSHFVYGQKEEKIGGEAFYEHWPRSISCSTLAFRLTIRGRGAVNSLPPHPETCLRKILFVKQCSCPKS